MALRYKVRLFYTAISLLFWAIPLPTAAQDCDGLIHFRDVELFEHYDKAFNKYQLTHDALNEIRRIRQETLDEREWNKLQSTQTATTDGGLATAFIAQNIKIACTLISDLLKFNPATGLAGAAAEKTSLTAERIYNTIKLGKSLSSVVDEGAEKTAYKEVLTMGGPLGQAVKTAWNFSEGVSKMASLGEDRNKLRSEVQRILDMVDHAATKYQLDIEKSAARLKELNNIKAGIDKYLAAYCKADSKKDSTATAKRTPAKDNIKPAATASTSKKVTGNAFYIFLTASMPVNGKQLTVISPPILHKGALTDNMADHKKDFINWVGTQLPNRPDDFRQQLEQEDYKTIAVHYAKPFSTSLLTSVNDSFDAINAFKQSIRDAVEGLPNADLIDFFQLN